MGDKMFGTNGVRGVADEYMSCELALMMGRAAGKVLGRRIAVACDPRTSSQMIKDALCAGLMSVGSDVLDLGMIPTPALQHWIKVRSDVDGGVMITASHNPPEFNGIKCIAGDGTECTKGQEDEIEAAYHAGPATVGWQEIGTTTRVEGAAEEYIDSVVSKVDADAIRKAGIKAVLDCANGCSCATSPMLLERLGVTAIVINGEPDMRHPGHLSEPTEDNLRELLETVKETGADIGIAHDGDADRVVFATASGRYVPGDKALAILGRYLLDGRRGRVVVTVATSRVVEDTVAAARGETVYTAVGSPVVAREMAADGAVFGGEENGGLIFADHQFCRDGAMGAARMLECIVRRGALDGQVDSLPRYTTIKKAVKCPEELKQKVTSVIASRNEDARIDRTDGLKLIYDDGWVLLRPSGTEPKYRIYSESKDPATAEERSERFVQEFDDALEELSESRSALHALRELGLHLHDGPDLRRVYPADLRHVHGDVVAEHYGPEHVLQRSGASEPDRHERRSGLLQLLLRPLEVRPALVASDEQQEQAVATGGRPP